MLATSGLALSTSPAGTAVAGTTVDGAYQGAGLAAGGAETKLMVAGRGGVPANATAVALNLTVTGTTSNGWASVYPCGTPRPNSSNINFTTSATIANSVITKLGPTATSASTPTRPPTSSPTSAATSPAPAATNPSTPPASSTPDPEPPPSTALPQRRLTAGGPRPS